jgi:hypothetical protein
MIRSPSPFIAVERVSQENMSSTSTDGKGTVSYAFCRRAVIDEPSLQEKTASQGQKRLSNVQTQEN